MKKIILFVMFILFSWGYIYANSPETSIQQSFDKKFPCATKIHWSKESPNVWVAEFIVDGEKLRARYSMDKCWFESTSENVHDIALIKPSLFVISLPLVELQACKAINPNAGICTCSSSMNPSPANGIVLAAKAILSGPYDVDLGLMNDLLRTNLMIPTDEPYSGATYLKPIIGVPAGETVSAAILSVNGSNAIVDWIFLELRSATNSSQIVATKRALIQRDGDIVSCEDGTSPVFFEGFAPDDYYISVKHRNHLGIMTATALHLDSVVNGLVDFTSCAVWELPGEINGPRRMYGTVATLWSSDGNKNKNTKYNGISNDKQEVLNAVGAGTSNNVLAPVYRQEDLNMDAKVKYNNTNNDRNVILGTVGSSTFNNVVNQQTPN